MDPHLQRGLHDKLYEKRKAAALELERLIRDTAALPDSLPKLRQIVDQLCADTYSSSHPHIRNGGLIGLAAACIALGPSVARFLEDIIPPVLACFTDQDSRVRYYACESMYNIAKVAKGETLLYFNEVFDSLCRLAADSELSVKNGAELLDRLVKDIVSEKAATYVSVLQGDGYGSGVVTPVSEEEEDDGGRPRYAREVERTTAFSLERFIPMVAERIYVINPFTRTFLVSWIILLNSIPDLELITHLPAFLDGLLKFLADPNKDVRTATHVALNDFLAEIRRIAEIKKISGKTAPVNGTQTQTQTQSDDTGAGKSFSDADSASHGHSQPDTDGIAHSLISPSTPTLPFVSEPSPLNPIPNPSSSDIYIPGQDVPISHPALLHILLPHLSSPIEEIQHTALTWVNELFGICGQELLEFVPRVLERVLPVLSSGVEKVRGKAGEVSGNLRGLVMGLPEPAVEMGGGRGSGSGEGRKGSWSAQSEGSRSLSPVTMKKSSMTSALSEPQSSSLVESQSPVVGFAEKEKEEKGGNGLDYATTVSALTLQFLNEHEETRVAALDWLYWLHKKAPTKVLAMDDGTFPVLLKTLSDPSEKVVTRDLQLLALVSSSTSDDYFTSFMLNLVSLFSTDRRLLEIRGSLIVRQLCVSLSGERIYRTLAEILERDDDLEFAGIMVQNLSMGLITAPELGDLRKRLRNLETKDGQLLFTSLYRSWCHNAVATFSLCLLAQAYEQASNLLQIFADLEITVSLLIQVDKLVQLLESPVFTYLRLQLLEPEKYPYLFKCLYGLLMLLPQSSAFATLRNRLNAVNSMGFIHLAPKTPSTVFERGTGSGVGVGPKGRKGVDEIKWPELLEKFRNVQLRHEKARRTATLKNPPVFAFDPLSTRPHETPNSTPKENGMGKDGGLSRGGSTPSTPTTAGPGANGKGHGRSKSIGLANRLYQARQKRKE
ncbi:ARM repeat-containing protein [Saitoella complicata NRRL Y-17804]|uniref:Vacuolar protein 14 C-terminal Fig4-binding domain-containing protein n=1 Tax=Saitoella complicata (strain BCRC 22490 / CBS 7301 / JCM 7358 / NBRC 10748 / NRRL Y-17804) TaxID=698492 RepID=A0A0E9N975_SAICN|nr:ARM repeat-containing protein [Saitoella complicata NRRL Y-17804]ODQ56601.1 ARM repeat-containing protein [Saitoella complicata NRRL Y-17804]GAO46427.1 hypothetical protein G7K_0658-t1 [Saitoella complicata NRRL Y-17804]